MSRPDDEEIRALRQRLAEAEEIIQAIRAGAVDALLIDGIPGPEVYTLTSADRLYRQMIEDMSEGALTICADRTIFYCNRRLAEIVGRPMERILGRPVAAVLDVVEPDLLEAVLAGRSRHCEVSIPVGDGQRLPVKLSASRLRSDDDEVISMVVTDLRVERDRDRLRDANRSKDEFLALLGHELRNPMAAIRGAVQLMSLDRSGPDEHRTSIEILERQSRQMVRLIDDLLDVSRVSQGKVRLRLEPVDVVAIARKALDAVRRPCEELGQDTALSAPSRSVYVCGDADRLMQIVSNLLTNASKFTGRGGAIRVTVDARAGNAYVSVRDSGIGIAANHLTRIFEPFTLVGAPISGSASGLGLGLPLVKGLVEMHHGSVDAHSDGIGRGSEFVVRLPAMAEPEPAAPRPARDRGVWAARARRILVVDDNQDSAAMLARLLRLQGHEVMEAYDGLGAVRAAEEHQPEVVLLDIGLPDIEGYEVAERIRASEARARRTFLIALSGWGQAEDVRRSHAAGFDAHLTKPADLDRLNELLQSAGVGAEHRSG